jgi:hypothetical protein
MSNSRIAGRIFFSVDGQQHAVGASITYNLGRSKRESMSSSAHEHFYKEAAQVPYIAGELIDKGTLDVAKFLDLDGVTITAELANSKTIVLRDAWQVGEGEVNGEEGMISFRFDGKSAEELS